MAPAGGKTGDDEAGEAPRSRRAATANDAADASETRRARRDRRLATGTVAPDLAPSDAVDPREILRIVFGGVDRPREVALPADPLTREEIVRPGGAPREAGANAPRGLDHVHVVCSCRRHGAAHAYGATAPVLGRRRARPV